MVIRGCCDDLCWRVAEKVKEFASQGEILDKKSPSFEVEQASFEICSTRSYEEY
jgi:hypothetical protein